MKIDVLILGAGIAGLGAAQRCRDLGREAVIFEASAGTGGLLDNFIIDGFRFDNAVHLSFATEPEVRKIFDQTPFYTHPADSRCFDAGYWLKHPVQNNLFPLPAARKVELIKSFVGRDSNDGADIKNYEDWLRHQYGDLIAESYPIAYTRKYWDTEPSGLSTTWIGNRMRRAEIEEVLFGAFTPETPNTYYTKEMRYPKDGGYKAFIQSLIDASDIRTEKKAVRIDPKAKLVHFEDESVVEYNEIVSSIPLPIMANITIGADDQVTAAANSLQATSIDLISVAFKEELPLDLWMYIYDADIFASRAYSPSVKARSNVPPGCSSLQFEVYQRGRDSKYRPEELKENTIYALERMGIARHPQILFTHHKRLPWGNVIFDLGMEEARQQVRDFMEVSSIRMCGRFGEWDYLWSNQSYLSGYKSF